MKFSKDGFWVKQEEDRYRVGLAINDVEDVGEISYIELASPGDMKEGDTFLNLEASKVVSEFVSPLTGQIIEVNNALSDEPAQLQSNELEKNWIAVFEKVSEDSLSKLVDEKPKLLVSRIKME